MAIGFLKKLLGSRIELRHVNREAIVAKPKEPFILWVTNLPKAKPIHDPETGEVFDPNMSAEAIRVALTAGNSIYLLPVTDTGKLEEATLRAVYKTIFERELRDWNTNQKTWPRNLSYELFLQWFELAHYDSTYDLCQAPLESELWNDEI